MVVRIILNSVTVCNADVSALKMYLAVNFMSVFTLYELPEIA